LDIESAVQADESSDGKVRIDRASLEVLATVYDATDPSVHQSSRAHGAWFERHVDGCVDQTPCTAMSSCVANGFDLRVSRWILMELTSISPASDDVACGIDHDSAHGNISIRCCETRLFDGGAHERFVLRERNPDG